MVKKSAEPARVTNVREDKIITNFLKDNRRTPAAQNKLNRNWKKKRNLYLIAVVYHKILDK